MRVGGLRGALAALVLGTAAAGCGGGDGLPRQAVSGSVTLDGKPLAGGSIQFQPGPGSSAAVSGGAVIADGRFAIAREQGLVPGSYKVMIFSHGGAEAAPEAPGPQTGPPPERIPARYNASTTLTADVAQDKPNEFQFELKSQ
jgi:hypothetical protein